MSLLILAGERCQTIMNTRIKNIQPRYIQADEIWGFIGKKQKQVRIGDPSEFGDAWIFVAMDEETKLVPCFEVGKRSRETTRKFLSALKNTLSENRFQLTTDGFHFYERGVEDIFAGQADFAQLVNYAVMEFSIVVQIAVASLPSASGAPVALIANPVHVLLAARVCPAKHIVACTAHPGLRILPL
jgi:IS1 family transposase